MLTPRVLFLLVCAVGPAQPASLNAHVRENRRNIRAGGTADFYPFGVSAGDAVNPKADDGGSPKQTSAYAGGFPYFGQVYRDFWVNNNGVVSFEGEVTIFTPYPFPIQSFPIVAVFWADVDNRRAGEVYWRQTTTDQALLTQVSQDIVDNHPGISSFQAGWVLVATYDDVTYYGGSSNTSRQSFQVVLATDGIQSFAIFKYGDILWTTGSASMGDAATGLGGVPAQAGFNSGDGTNYYTVPGSRSSEIVDVETRSNVGQPGTFMYQINDAKILPLGRCQ
ncbi:sushi, nidogen and EGF-like domain-containing protein 1 [Branchiostoma floridae x Branchiostoma belcheri]